MPTLIAFATGQLLAVVSILFLLTLPLLVVWFILSIRRDLSRVANALEKMAATCRVTLDRQYELGAAVGKIARDGIPFSQLGR